MNCQKCNEPLNGYVITLEYYDNNFAAHDEAHYEEKWHWHCLIKHTMEFGLGTESKWQKK